MQCEQGESWGVGARLLHPGLSGEQSCIHFKYLTACWNEETDGEESILHSICATKSKYCCTFFLTLSPFKWKLNVSGKHLLGKQRLENLKVSLFKQLQLSEPWLPPCPLMTAFGTAATGNEVACYVLMHADHFTTLQVGMLTSTYSSITTRYFKIPQFLK